MAAPASPSEIGLPMPEPESPLSDHGLPPAPPLPADVIAMIKDAGCEWVLEPEHWPGNWLL